MKKCINCGTDIEDAALFCPECGAKQISESVFCPNCGTQLPSGAAFCSECGTPINAETPAAAPVAVSGEFSVENLFKSRQQEYAASQQIAIKEEQKRLAEEAARKAEELARKEEEERIKREEEERKKAEAKAKREEEKRKKEEQARLKREEDERKKAEAADAKRLKEEQERLKREEEAQKAVEANKKKAKEKATKVQAAEPNINDNAVEPVKIEPQHATMESVDLGLSVKWAKCNLGAKDPEEFGDYFAWGEVSPKDEYGYGSNYKHAVRGYVTKYNTNSKYGNTVDGIKQLEPSDDAAHQILGGGWRMPTMKEVDELRTNCSISFTSINGVKGVKIKSKKKGYTDNWIFLPGAGYRSDELRSSSKCYYWTSSLYTRRPDCGFKFFWDEVSEDCIERYYGLTIRPVMK